jgi:hypothetical protein
MRHVSLYTLWDAIVALLKSVYQWALNDAKKMAILKEEHRKMKLAEMDQDPAWSQSRGTDGQSWHIPEDDEDIIGI